MRRSPTAHDEGAGDVKALVMAALVVVGLFVAGSLVVWALHALFGVLFYVLIGALIVGGVVFIAGRVRKSVGGSDRRQLR
ncbi:hypothetical protein [Actinocatenispora rupis]|uniref:hypothetical protein n=1 Tax=Actinocatenispora rupis TaxID=519421 RepID=UPI001941D175|nr:hypothetical protein [Actinocatenispora rupis]